ncbi:MAG: aldehyde dehydrogenase (NADP(+)) [Planctomycetaceae bacterium]|nr:aldehyde dehydrogenase (NADP(+)) [Planctomycetaceae bacterium]
MTVARIYLAGEWREPTGTKTFQAHNPQTGQVFGDEYPVSNWDEIDLALKSATKADAITRGWPGSRFAELLERYADVLDANADPICELANQETALPVTPRLKNGELPRTTNQLRLAAAEARTGAWALPTIDRENDIRSIYRSIGPVLAIGPNNFPLAYNGISGGDFAAVVAAGNPIIAKAHPAHPGTSRLMAELLQKVLQDLDFPAGFAQMLYDMHPADGLRMVRDPRIAAVGFTGSQRSGVAIKAAADACGKPVFLEMSSINPIFILPGALSGRFDEVVNDFLGSCLLGSGQFCTNPGLVILPPGADAARFVKVMQEKFAASTPAPLLAANVKEGMLMRFQQLLGTGAELLAGGKACAGDGYRVENTLFQVSAERFLATPEAFLEEVFGNSSLMVMTSSEDQYEAIAGCLNGQLTGCFYTTEQAADEALYRKLEPVVRRKVGRLLNNKMPTGVAVSPAMNHGGPFPATGHPGFTAVGFPASMRRFSMLACYDHVAPQHLPELLRD